jgi:hypothetical protein
MHKLVLCTVIFIFVLLAVLLTLLSVGLYKNYTRCSIVRKSFKVHVSFITTIKICKGYEWLVDSIVLYVRNVQAYAKKYGMTYEILICEQFDDRNVLRIGDVVNLSMYGDVTVIPMKQAYPNPYGYNMIESYGKNACLARANGVFTCMTSADQLFSEAFFNFISNQLRLGVFYRFATYEIPVQSKEFASLRIEEILKVCNSTKTRLCNPGCFSDKKPINWRQLGEKSGDVMVLDTASFISIKGWPESKYFTHMDTVVCIVASSQFKVHVPDKSVCTFTFEQKRHSRDPHEEEAWQYANSFAVNKQTTCN